MSMKGVDIASHQQTIDCAKIKADFVIVKATQGVTYTNPYFSKHYAQAKASGKLTGSYHYASGGDPIKEADYYMSVVGPRIGDGILAVDWEHNVPGGENPVFNTSGEVEWCRKFAERIHSKTGVWPFIYMSASVTRRRDWSPVAKHCPLWLAQYGSTKLTDYQSAPWTDGAKLGAWGRNIPIHQYSPSGSISGYRQSLPHKLDLDIAYISKNEWEAYAKGSGDIKAEIKYPEMTDTDLAVEVLFNHHGTNETRRESLGMRYDAVQADVEDLVRSVTKTVVATQQYLKKHGCKNLI